MLHSHVQNPEQNKKTNKLII